MKKQDIKIGQVYKAKVTGKISEVRITGENPHGGWEAVNVATNRKIHIKSAQRIRGVVQREAKRKKIVTLAQYEAETTSTSATGAKKSPKATGKAKTSKKSDTDQRRAKGAKRPSGLDAATQVLGEAGEPLNTGQMVERMLSKGLWKTNGKTPASTIYAAILREITTKGKQSRFRKVQRGKFTLNG